MQFKFRHSSLLCSCFYCDNIITKYFASAVGYSKTYLLCFIVLFFTFISHPFVGVTGAFLLVSACSAQTASGGDKNALNPPEVDNTPTPVPILKNAPRPPVENEGVQQPPNQTQPQVLKNAPRPPVENEGVQQPPNQTQPQADQNQPRPQPPCEGMAADAVSPRVQEFLSCEVIRILAKPDRVQSFRVKSEPNPAVPESERLGNYPIEPGGAGTHLSAEQLKNLQSLLFSEKSYVFDAEKRCKFRPEIGLHFIRGQEAVDVLFSFDCELWLFIHKGKEKLEDFDPVRKQLKELRKSLFPTTGTPVQN